MKINIIWQPDKNWHFLIGMLIPILVSCLSYFVFNQTFWFSLILGFGLSIFAGAFKELVWDKMLGNGAATWMDFIVTFLGAFVGTFMISLPILNHFSNSVPSN